VVFYISSIIYDEESDKQTLICLVLTEAEAKKKTSLKQQIDQGLESITKLYEQGAVSFEEYNLKFKGKGIWLACRKKVLPFYRKSSYTAIGKYYHPEKKYFQFVMLKKLSK